MERISVEELKSEHSIDVIKGLIKINKGYITSKQVTDIGIHRMYLNIMQKQNIIERVRPGIYIDKNIIEDVYYVFNLKHEKIIFSGFTALYFHGLTEKFPYNFSITVYRNYHSKSIEKEHNVYRVKNDIFELGLTQVKTPHGNFVRAYDKERCICDIIKYKDKLDFEQVKKSIKMYLKDKNTNSRNLDIYAKKMGIYHEVMEIVGMYYE